MQLNSPSSKTDPAIENTSGQGLSAAVPPDIEGWNWGAFFLTWIWGIGNRVWLSFLALIPIPLVGLAMMVILGIKGNEWAWQCKKWDSIEQFRHKQRIWMYWGIAAFIAPFVFLLGLALIIAGLLGYYGYI